MSKLPVCAINPIQEQMLAAFEDLHQACLKKKEADAKQWEIKEDPIALVEFQPEWNKAFNDRTIKRNIAYALVEQHPKVAADLIERLVRIAVEVSNED